MKINLIDFGNIISTDETSKEIYKLINEELKKGDVIIDAENVVLSTKSSRMIFGKLYTEMGKDAFNSKISFKNTSTSFLFALREGIITEIKFRSKKNNLTDFAYKI